MDKMSTPPILLHILADARYQEMYSRLMVSSILDQFPSIRNAVIPTKEDLDWPYLLFAASALAQSDDSACQDHALRTASACMRSGSEHFRDSAALILNELANRPAIKLAEVRGFIKPNLSARLGTAARLSWAKLEGENEIVLSNSASFHGNHFQVRFWRALTSNYWLSVSASTSVGKSFVALQWLLEQLSAGSARTAVIIVPTRALIHQTEMDLRRLIAGRNDVSIKVASVPIKESLVKGHCNALVFTQERLHIFLSAFSSAPSPVIDYLFVDEAQKVNDGSRGVLLQDSIERVVAANPEVKVIFSSPSSTNPEILLQDAPTGVPVSSVVSNDVTVAQNLLWVSQHKGKPQLWDISLASESTITPLGSLTLPFPPTDFPKRLAFVAYGLAAEDGNIIYVNGAAEAEKVAVLLYEMSVNGAPDDVDIIDLSELIELTVHSQYLLRTVLKRRVAFHYGNMPLLLRTEIERLFNENKLRFLVCTSTLIEGVNLPCKNLFVRNPTKGRGKPMNSADFWNLAGRAGRWGREFQGNIVCVDPDRWTVPPPTVKSKYEIGRAADEAFSSNDVLNFILDKTPRDVAAKRDDLESTSAYLMSVYLRSGKLDNAIWAKRVDAEVLNLIDSAIRIALQGLRTDVAVVLRNPGISPLAMDSLMDAFAARSESIEGLIPLSPSSNDAWNRYAQIFQVINTTLSANVFGNEKRINQLANLVTLWMRGYPLKRLIEDRLKFLAANARLPDATARNNAIRGVMNDVESVARFLAPKYLSCYVDVLRQFLASINKADLLSRDLDLNLFLEFGVSTKTTLSLMNLGLSRTSAIAIAAFIPSNDLTAADLLPWLREGLWEQLELPALVRREIFTLLESSPRAS